MDVARSPRPGPARTAVGTRPAIGRAAAGVIGAGLLLALTSTASAATPGVKLRPVAGGLGDALLVTHAPGEKNRLYVVQQSGTIRILQRGRLLRRPFLDVSGRISRGGERGLLGLAFHPRYARNGRFFVNYTDRSGATRVMEFRRGSRRINGRLRPTVNRARQRPHRTLMRIAQPFANHNGGHLAFGRDGMLHVGTGDGGSGGDPGGRAQRLDTLLGKILRVDVNGRTRRNAYRIPRDNPFRGRRGARPEIWITGVRNPWRFSFDRARGDLWIGDVGQSAREEINRLTPTRARGANLGWNAFEGSLRFGGVVRGRTPVGPVAEYGRAQGCSVTGGYVYRGSRVPALRGRYVYGDFCTGRIWSMRAGPRPGGVRLETGLGPALGNITSFGEGADGTIYVVASGRIYRFVRG